MVRSGLEALSRGAAHVTFIEKDRRAAAAIDELAREWQEAEVWVQSVDALSWLARIAGCRGLRHRVPRSPL